MNYNFSGTLKKIEQNYVSGAPQFFEQLTPDPWQTAHDTFEAALLTKDEQVISKAVISFEHRVLGLLRTYKKMMELSDAGELKQDLFHDWFLTHFK